MDLVQHRVVHTRGMFHRIYPGNSPRGQNSVGDTDGTQLLVAAQRERFTNLLRRIPVATYRSVKVSTPVIHDGAS
jgi:hypothetical protein